ncbi:unnamed protein product [Gongylonema pulchrum]|uniref:GMP_PDE_delta domain-containing protein n=1 Tax=Gongylonema pulchrum TaxID=637853 RepID=A0A183D8G9_9BILA|nr:unnamed protein product [Gongylonema pulchrum]
MHHHFERRPNGQFPSRGSVILERVMPGPRRCPSSTTADNRIREPLTEAELRSRPVIAPEDVLRLNKITDDYLCEPEANTFGIEFTRFKIRDLDTDQVLFEIAKPAPGEICVTLAPCFIKAVTKAFVSFIEDVKFPHDFHTVLKFSDDELEGEEGAVVSCEETSATRFVRYQFTPAFLLLKRVGATLVIFRIIVRCFPIFIISEK